MYFINRILFFSFFFTLFINNVNAGILKGTVSNTKGVPLPYATIFLEGTTIGTTANGNGNYVLNVSPGLYKIVCQIIGYKQSSINISISDNETVLHNFILIDQNLVMKEVVIHANAEDPAYNIIRHAIEKRKFHLDQVKSFQTSLYLKVVGRSRKLPDKFLGQKIKTPDLDVDSAGRGVLFLTEEYADYYSDNGQEQTVIHSVHESGNSAGLGLAKLPPVITLYENIVTTFGARGSISPISDNALYYYHYKYLGQFTEQDKTINKIQVTQKRPFEPCFNGIIYITDEDYAIHSLDLTLVKSSGIEPFDTVKIEQLFLPQKQDEWVIKSQLLYLTAKIFSFDITANVSSLYNNQKINQPIPDSIFHKKTISIYDHCANKKDTTYWKDNRPVPLEKDETKNFIVQDSLYKKVTGSYYLDSVRRKENILKPLDILFSGKTFNSKNYKNTYTINSLLFLTNYNIAEGINLAPKISWRHLIDTGKNLVFNEATRYGCSNNHLKAIFNLYYISDNRSWKGRRWLFGIEAGKYVFQYNPQNPMYQLINTAYVLLFNESDLKIYENTVASAFLQRKYGNGFSWFAKISYQQRQPLQNTSVFSFYKHDDSSYYNNLPPHLSKTTVWEPNNAALFHLLLTWKPGYKYIQYPDFKQPIQGKFPRFIFSYDKGIPGIFDSKSNFDKYRLSITDNFSLKLMGNLSYNIALGGFLNNAYVSVPDLMHPNGNRGIGFASPYLESFQFMQYYDYSNKENLYGEAHLEYKLNGFLSNKVPLMRKAQLNLVMGGNALYINKYNYYAEAFIGIDNIGWNAARFLRIDFVQSWDNNNIRNSGIRFGISLGKGVSFSFGGSNDFQSEW